MESGTLFRVLGVAALAGVIAALASTILRPTSGNQFALETSGRAEEVVRLNPSVVEWPNHLENQEAFAALIPDLGAPSAASFDTVIPQDLSSIRVIARASTTDEARTELERAVDATLSQRLADQRALLEPEVQASRQAVTSLESQLGELRESHRDGAGSDADLQLAATALAKERESLELLQLSSQTAQPPVVRFAADPRRPESTSNNPLLVGFATALFAGFIGVQWRRAAS